MDIRFYHVDTEYIEFLKSAEIKARGYTCVPNSQYANRDKFFYGTVLTKNGMNYFVPISHTTAARDNAIVLTSKKKSGKNKFDKYGSLRFNYMIPVPHEMLIKFDFDDIKDEGRKRLVINELAFCKRNRDKIQKQAEISYADIITSKKEDLLKNSCDFKILEQACIEFCKIHNLDYLITE